MRRLAQNKYRIGFQNPWKNAAENQACRSMQIAAARLGHELVEVVTSHDIEQADLDFVIATASTQAKMTDIPTFGAIHEPRERFWQNRRYFDNLLSYDGYFTISDSINRFLREALAGFGRDCPIGSYYNSPQYLHHNADIQTLTEEGPIRLCYFGTNWDARSRPLFRALAQRDYMRIYGPKASWAYLKGEAYSGSPPFDGQSVQREYAVHGAGLVCLSREHMLDDVISNRIFEIASVGAIAICPDIPWIRKHFGNSVCYYSALGTPARAIADIDQAMKEIAHDPGMAAERARRAKEIFRDRFCAEVMLSNAVTYYEDWQSNRPRWEPSEGPLIDVIVRVGGRPVETVGRALDSIDAQTRGRFRIILVKYKPIDVSSLIEALRHRITEFEEVECIHGNRSMTLCAGLKRVSSPLFAVLDDDDFWLNNHIETLLESVKPGEMSRAFVYSGTIADNNGDPNSDEERREIVNMSPGKGSVWDILGVMAMNAFLASSDLLKVIDLDGWRLDTAEDSVLEAHLLAHGQISFSYRPTACFFRNKATASNFVQSTTRLEDEFECFARISSLIPEIERKFAGADLDPWERLGWAMERLQDARTARMTNLRGRWVLKEESFGDSIHDIPGLNLTEIKLASSAIRFYGNSILHGLEEAPMLLLSPPAQPWAYGAVLNWQAASNGKVADWLVAELDCSPGNFGFGFLDSNNAFIDRLECPESAAPLEIWMPIPPGEVAEFVLQNWIAPVEKPVTIKHLWLVAD